MSRPAIWEWQPFDFFSPHWASHSFPTVFMKASFWHVVKKWLFITGGRLRPDTTNPNFVASLKLLFMGHRGHGTGVLRSRGRASHHWGCYWRSCCVKRCKRTREHTRADNQPSSLTTPSKRSATHCGKPGLLSYRERRTWEFRFSLKPKGRCPVDIFKGIKGQVSSWY